jgi:hypothetical protein
MTALRGGHEWAFGENRSRFLAVLMTLASSAGRKRADGTLSSSRERAISHFAMTLEVNRRVVGDSAKLIMHRLIARQIRRDPALVDRARIAHAHQADQFTGWPFVREWDELLSLPPDELTSKLISRDREMARLRNSSPFYLCEGVDFEGYKMRIRISRAARRIVERGLAAIRRR